MTEPVTTPVSVHSTARSPLVWRIFKWTAISVAVLVLVVVGLLFVPGVRQFAFEQGRSILAGAGVQSESIGGDWTEMTLTNVAMNDDQGTWATASAVTLAWSPWGLLSGTVDATHVEFRGARVLRKPAYKPAPDQADEPFAWPSLPVDITMESLTGDVTLDPSVIGEAITASLDGKASLTAGGGDAALALTRTDGVPGEVSLTAKSDSELGQVELAINAKDARIASGLAGDARLQNLEVALQATRDGGVCTGQAAISARDGALATLGVNPNCTFALGLPEIGRLLDASAGISGPATLSVQLLEDGSDKTTRIQVAGDLSKLQAADPMLARLLPGASAGALVVFTAGGTQLDNLQGQLAGGKIAFTGSALVGKAVQAKIDLNASDLAILRPDLQGQLEASLAYDTTSPTPIAFTARGSNVVSGGLSWQTIDASGSVDALGSGNVALKAEGQAPIDVGVKIANAFGGALEVQATGTIAEAKIDARIAQSGTVYAVDATLDTAKLENLGAIAGVDVAGALKAHVTGAVGDPNAGLTLDATVNNARYGATEIGDATLSAKGPLTALVIDLKGNAPLAPRAVDYKVAAVIRNFASADVSTLSVISGKESATATAPFTVDFSGATQLKGLSLVVAHDGKTAGTILADAQLTPGGAKADADFKAIDLAALTAILGQQPVQGTLNAKASLDGGAGTAKLTGTVDGLRAGDTGGRVPPANLAIDGSWTGGRVALSVTAKAPGLPNATARIAFPMARAEGGGFPSPAPNAPLEGAVDWNGKIGPLWRLADIGAADLDGDAKINAKIGGALNAPKFSGAASFANGSFVDDASGLRLVKLNLSASVDGDRVALKGTGSDGGQGKLSIDAATTLGGGIGATSGGLTLTAMQLLTRDDLVARIDGSIKLAAAGANPLLSGKLTVTGLEAEIPQPAPPDLVAIDVIDPAKGTVKKAKNMPVAKAEPVRKIKPASAPAAQTIGLDITISIPGPAKVRGRGLDSLWQGDLHIVGDLTDPRIAGKLKLMRGQWTFGPRTLTLSNASTIEFDGGPAIEPIIDITATQEDSDFVGELHLTGRASAPQITATSTPSAPQDEIFAHILFGRSVTKLSPLEGLQLANSIAEISGSGGGGPGVLDSIKDRFGLDVLTVDLGDGGSASVKAGRYLTKNVYFELHQGGDSAGTSGRLELEVTDSISVETEVGADSSSSVGARYKYDY